MLITATSAIFLEGAMPGNNTVGKKPLMVFSH